MFSLSFSLVLGKSLPEQFYSLPTDYTVDSSQEVVVGDVALHEQLLAMWLTSISSLNFKKFIMLPRIVQLCNKPDSTSSSLCLFSITLLRLGTFDKRCHEGQPNVPSEVFPQYA
jgi:hypothetical protein